MNKQETIAAIKVMQAWIDGEEILINGNVLLVCKPEWNWSSTKYIVKPEPIERWIGIFSGNMRDFHSYDTKEECDIYNRNNDLYKKAIKLVVEI